MLVIIEDDLYIESCYLDSNIAEHILDKLKRTVEGTCTYSHGYILKIFRVIKTVDNQVSTNGTMIIFRVLYEADVIKPTIGLVLKGTVCMIFQQGILVDVKGVMKIFIPVSALDKFKFYPLYEDNGPSYVNKKEKKIISNGVELDVQIVVTKYEQKKFDCIGKLK